MFLKIRAIRFLFDFNFIFLYGRSCYQWLPSNCVDTVWYDIRSLEFRILTGWKFGKRMWLNVFVFNHSIWSFHSMKRSSRNNTSWILVMDERECRKYHSKAVHSCRIRGNPNSLRTRWCKEFERITKTSTVSRSCRYVNVTVYVVVNRWSEELRDICSVFLMSSCSLHPPTKYWGVELQYWVSLFLSKMFRTIYYVQVEISATNLSLYEINRPNQIKLSI